MGYPVLGDLLYGGFRANRLVRTADRVDDGPLTRAYLRAVFALLFALYRSSLQAWLENRCQNRLASGFSAQAF